MKLGYIALAATGIVAAAVPANAAVFTNLYNTGVNTTSGTDNSYAVQYSSTANSTYSGVSSALAQVVSSPVWDANNATSSWISTSSGAYNVGGYYLYTTTFNASKVTGADQLGLNFEADDTITRILLNGIQVYTGSISGLNYNSFTGVNVSGLQNGLNTLQFEVYNTGGSRQNATGLRAELSAVPEAATWAMMISGFGLVGISLRRNRKVGVALA
jgi:hypothetical protein